MTPGSVSTRRAGGTPTVASRTVEEARYCIFPSLFRLHGPPNIAALEQTLYELERRVGFDSGSGKTANPQRIVSIDLRSLPEELREARAREIATEESVASCNRSGRNMLRARLLQLG